MTRAVIEDRIKEAVDAYGADVSASVDAWAAIQRRVRSGRSSWLRRLGLWAGALGVLIGVGVPVEQALAPAGHGGTRVVTIKPAPAWSCSGRMRASACASCGRILASPSPP